MTKSDDELVAMVIAEHEAWGEDITHERGPKPRTDVADAIRRIWGAEALECLPPGTSGLKAPELRIAGHEPCVWLVLAWDFVPGDVDTRFFFEAGRWVSLRGIEAWKRFVTSQAIDILHERARSAALEAFAQVVPARIVTTREEAEGLVDASPPPDHPRYDVPPIPADPVVVELFEPPHFEGRVFVFQANLDGVDSHEEPAFLRVAMDADTGAIDVRRLARGGRSGEYHEVLEGRAYVDDSGAPRLAPAMPVASLVPSETPGAAAAWIEAARAEHASVASFARASMELMAVGAPLDLVRRTHEAALDEIRHTELALDVARRFGATATLGALPALAPRASTVGVVATTTLLEAAVNETLAAFSARVAAKLCADDEVRRALHTIAADEERHAALAWDVITWACGVDGDARSQIRALATGIEIPASSSRSDDDACGQLTAKTEREAWRVAFEEKVRPRLAALTGA